MLYRCQDCGFGVVLMVSTMSALLPTLPAWASPCKPQVEVPDTVMERRLVVFGELHGTREAPALVSEHVCMLASRGHEVVLALELPGLEQDGVDAYLASQGTAADTAAFLQGPFWERPTSRQDGRSSAAMLELVERIRQLRREGQRVRIVAIDRRGDGLPRDASMANAVRDAMHSRPEARFVVLVGNIHARNARGTSFDPDFEPLALLLADLQPLTLNVVSRGGGEAWVCSPQCGVRAIGADVHHPEPGVHLGSSTRTPPGYGGTVVLEKFHASPPAMRPAQSPD